jgi:ribosomal protein S18 acetylase RimI-like enzyme
MSSPPLIRPYTPGDRAACSRICVLTGHSGTDATGELTSDEIWGEIFVLPYLDRHPDYAWVVDVGAGSDLEPDAAHSHSPTVVGYIVCTPDTHAFENWFSTQYWPSRARRFEGAAGATEQEVKMLRYAAHIGRRNEEVKEYTERYPAHLHINLLPSVQGQGLGRRMIETLLDKLKREGIRGVYLGASAENHAACAFYAHIGFREIEGEEGVRRFVMDLQDTEETNNAQTE